MRGFLFSCVCLLCCLAFAMMLRAGFEDDGYPRAKVWAVVFAATFIGAVSMRMFQIDKQRSLRRDFRTQGPRGFSS